MAITDHVGTLVAGSFDKPQLNKLKKDAPPQFYAVVAFDPAAGAALGEAMATVAPGGNWAGLQHGVKKNSTLAKPYVGIPDDALIVRFSSQYAPEIYDLSGQPVAATQENSAHIRSQLFAGQRVRINGAPYAWNFQGKQGLSFNLYGVLAVGGGERRATTGGSFDQYLPEQSQQSQPAGNGSAAAFGVSSGNAGATDQQTRSNADPFQQSNVNPNDPFGTNS